MNRVMFLLVIFVLTPAVSVASQVKVISKYSVEDTAIKYAKALVMADVPVLSEETRKKNLPGGFSRTEKEIQFRNPFYGASIGECHRGLRKDRPMSAKVYKDGGGKVWLEYSNPESYVNEFGVIECGNEADEVRRALGRFADSATE